MSGLKNIISKYFIALVLEGSELQAIEDIKQQLYVKHKLKGALRSPAHITLHRPFEWPEAKEAQLIEQLSKFEFGPHLQLEVRNFDWFEPRVIYANVLPNDALNELHSRLTRYCQRELKLLNELNDKRGFHPHITVAFRDLKKPKFYQLKPHFEEEKLYLKPEFKGLSLLKLHEHWQVCRTFR